MRHEVRLSYPGGTTVVELTRFRPGAVPNAFITQEPVDFSPGRTLVRDQVKLLNALRDMQNPILVKMVIDGDTRCRDLFCAALAVMDAPDPAAPPKERAA